MGPGVRPLNETGPFLNNGLPRLIRRMGLSGKDELHRALRIGQQADQPFRVVQEQIGSLVGCETPRKAQGQRIGIQDMACPFDHIQ